MQERETAAQKGKHQNITERIDGWSNRENDVRIGVEIERDSETARQRDRERESSERERDAKSGGERGNKREKQS